MSSTSLKYVMWSIGERYVPIALQISSTLILTRMILPADFAEVALTTVIIELLTLIISSGLADGLIYKNNNSEMLYSSVFFVNIGVAIFLYLALVSASGFISVFYGIPRLRMLIYIGGLNMIFYALSYIHRTIYTIDLNFRTPAKITFLSTILGCVIGLSLAFKGFGVWAIVFQTLSINASQSLLFWIINKWRPIWRFSWLELKTILPFSINVFLNNMVQSIYDNIYTLLLGKFQSAKSLGYYNRMQSVVYFTTTNLSYSLEHVYYPMLSKIREDKDELVSKYLLIIKLMTYVSFPILIILIGCGRDIIFVILSERWIGGYYVLKILCIAFFMMPLIYVNNSFMKLLNRTKALFRFGVLRKLVGISILLFTINTTINCVLYGIVLTFFIEWLITSLCIQFYLGPSLYTQVRELLPNFFINVFFLFLIFLINSYVNEILFRLSFGILVFPALYIAFSQLLGFREFVLIKSLIKK